jgi:hypothetical protein
MFPQIARAMDSVQIAVNAALPIVRAHLVSVQLALGTHWRHALTSLPLRCVRAVSIHVSPNAVNPLAQTVYPINILAVLVPGGTLSSSVSGSVQEISPQIAGTVRHNALAEVMESIPGIAHLTPVISRFQTPVQLLRILVAGIRTRMDTIKTAVTQEALGTYHIGIATLRHGAISPLATVHIRSPVMEVQKRHAVQIPILGGSVLIVHNTPICVVPRSILEIAVLTPSAWILPRVGAVLMTLQIGNGFVLAMRVHPSVKSLRVISGCTLVRTFKIRLSTSRTLLLHCIPLSAMKGAVMPVPLTLPVRRFVIRWEILSPLSVVTLLYLLLTSLLLSQDAMLISILCTIPVIPRFPNGTVPLLTLVDLMERTHMIQGIISLQLSLVLETSSVLQVRQSCLAWVSVLVIATMRVLHANAPEQTVQITDTPATVIQMTRGVLIRNSIATVIMTLPGHSVRRVPSTATITVFPVDTPSSVLAQWDLEEILANTATSTVTTMA